MEPVESKAAYAAFLLNEKNPFEAAKKLCPTDTGRALWVASNWANDPEVIAEVQRLKGDSRNIMGIATRYELAKFYWDLANDKTIEPKDRIIAAEKYGAVAQIYDPKATNTTNIKVDAAPRVMVVRDHGNDDEWEKKVERQQRELTNGKYVANSTRH